MFNIFRNFQIEATYLLILWKFRVQQDIKIFGLVKELPIQSEGSYQQLTERCQLTLRTQTQEQEDTKTLKLYLQQGDIVYQSIKVLEPLYLIPKGQLDSSNSVFVALDRKCQSWTRKVWTSQSIKWSWALHYFKISGKRSKNCRQREKREHVWLSSKKESQPWAWFLSFSFWFWTVWR